MKITKRQEKQLGEVSEHLQNLVKAIVDSSESDLPQILNANLKWDTSKGSLLNWVSVLNRFDDILERITGKYDLVKEYAKPVELQDTDIKLLISVLDFTHLLLENCTVKSVYSSSHRLFDLLNSPTIPIIIRVLRIFSVLGKKFSIRSSKKSSISTRKVSDRLYPFALFLPASTLTSNTGSSDNISLSDFVKDTVHPPKKWKQLEYVYFNNPNDSKLKEGNPLDSSIKKFNQQSISSSVASSPLKKKKTQSTDERADIAKAEALQGSRSLKFVMGEEDVRKLTLQQIFDKGSEKLPSKTWNRFCLKALSAKAFNSNAYDNIKLRRDLVIIKCLAISILVSVHTDFEVNARIFEADPTLLTSLIDLVNLGNSVPNDVRLAAIQTLDCVSSMKSWSSELVRGFGGTVPHGLLFQNLRHIKRQLTNNETKSISEEFNLCFFNFISNLVDTKTMSNLLVSVGLIQHLAEFLNIRTDHKHTLAGASHLLNSTLSGNSDNVAIFRDDEGFSSLVAAIGYEIDFALANPTYGGGPPKLTLVHYSISFKQANYIRAMMKFVLHLIQKESGDSIRNLFDSPLLQSINKILNNKSVFGFTLLTLAMNIVTAIIHNEPTSYTILKEANTIDIILNKFENFIGKSGELLTALPNIIGAIALNNEGLEKVKKHQLIQKFFTIFDNNTYAKALVTDDLTDLLSGEIDELARHYSQFKPIIVGEVVKLIGRLPEVGTKDLPKPFIYRSEKGSFYHSKNEEVLDIEEGAPELATWESIDEAYILENASVFIGNLIMFSNTWITIMDGLPFERWVSLICLNNSPFDYFYSNAMYPLNGALKYFDDERRDYAGKHFVNKAAQLLETVSEFSNSTNPDSVFLSSDIDSLDKLFNDLICVNNLLFAFTDVYCNPRSLSAPRVEQLSQYFSDEQGIKIIQNLGALLKRTAIEEYKIRKSMPTSVANESAVLHYDDGAPPLRVIDDEYKDDGKTKKNSAKYNNSIQVRFVLHRIHSSIATIFSTLSELPTTVRLELSLDNNRGKFVKISQEIGKILSNFLTDDLYDSPALLLVLVHSVQYCLTNSTTDRILTVGAITFMQENGYLNLRDILIYFWNVLLNQDNDKVKDMKPAPFVKDFPESIVVSIVMNILVHFNKINIFEQVVNVPDSPFFFEGGFDDKTYNSQAVNLKASFIVQTRILSLGTLNLIFDEDSLSSFDNDAKLPVSVVDEVIKLAKQTYSPSGFRELNQSDGSLPRMEWEKARTSYNRVKYLQSIGFEEEEAVKVLSNSSGGLSFLKSQDLPIGFEDLDRWKDIKRNCKVNRYQVHEPSLVKSQFKDCHTITELDVLLQMKSEFLLDQLYLLAQLHPEAIPNVTDFLLSAFLTRYGIASFQDKMFTILEFILSFEFSTTDNPRLAAMLAMFSELLFNDTVFHGCHSAIEVYVDSVVENLSSENATTDWGLQIITAFSKLVSVYHLPHVEKLEVPVAAVLPKALPVPFRVSEAVYDRVFEILISVPNINTGKSAYYVTNALCIYATNPDYSMRIMKSDIMKKLIRHISEAKIETDRASGKPKDISVSSRVAFAMLIRRCFESREFITEHIIREITKQFTSKRDGSKDKPKDLTSVLKDANGAVLRSPEIFIEEFVKRVRLNNFAEPLKNLSVVYREATDPEVTGEKNSKSDLHVAEQSTRLEKQTGIVHLILTELMTASKTNWLSDPPLTAEESKKKEEEAKENEFPKPEKVDPEKNKHCKYIIYLLKLLAELLSSYKQSKIEFLSFSRKPIEHKVEELIKPRSTSLNFLLHQLISGPGKHLPPNENARRQAVARYAGKVVVAFVSSLDTKEIKADPKRVDPDLTFIRKFTIDSIQKITREISLNTPVLETRYRKLVSICEVIPTLLSNLRDKLVDPLTTEFDDYQIAKIILESDLVPTLSQILAEVDLNYPEYFFMLESILNVLNNLGTIKNDRQELFRTNQTNTGIDEEEVEEDENDFKEETPDFFQNSTLGMYDVAEIDSEEEFSDDEIGYNEGDVSDDDDERDEDDIDHDMLPGRELEIVYSEEGDDSEEDDDGIIITSDEGEVVEDSEDVNSDEDMEGDSDSESASDTYIEYDLVPEANEDDQGEFLSELETGDSDGYEGEYFSGDEDIEGGSEGFEYEVEGEFFDSDLEEEMEDIIAEDDREDHHEHGGPGPRVHMADLDQIVSRAGISFTPRDNSDDGYQTAEEEDDFDEDDEYSEDDESIEERLGLGTSDHRSENRIFRRRPHGHIMHTPGVHRAMIGDLNIEAFDGGAIIHGLNSSRSSARLLAQNEDIVTGFLNGSGGFFPPIRKSAHFSVQSTRDRWNAFADSVFLKNGDYQRVINSILNRIFAPSKELAEKKKQEKEEARRLKEEERKKLEEENERKRLEEELETDDYDHESEANEGGAEEEGHRTPVMVSIGDSEVDIAGTDIDPEFFEALPEDMREEVFTHYIRQRRIDFAGAVGEPREIAQEFLDALPEALRDEIVAQEEAQTRFHGISDFLSDNSPSETDEAVEVVNENQDENKGKEKQKVYFTPLVDNAGVTALIRYIFVPQSSNGRKPLYRLLAKISINKKTRAEILDYLVAILQYGISDQESLEKVFAFITNSGYQANQEKSGGSKTSTPSQSKPLSTQSLFPHRATPFIVARQVLDALQFLLESDPQLRYYFLTEHEGISFSKKSASGRKAALVKPSKFPLNTLLSLLSKGLIREKSNLMDILSRIVQITTRPLKALKRAQASNEKKKIEMPSVLNSSLRNVITILVSDDCSSRTFQQTLSAIQNLLVVYPGGKVFASELSKDAKKLGDRLTIDLKALSDELSGEHGGVKDSNSEIMMKFTSSNSDQSKLLRVLTALDYLFGKSEKIDKDSDEHMDRSPEEDNKELTEIYNGLQLGELWGALSVTLELFETNKDIATNATALLPIIEALMVICKHSKVKEIQNKDVLKYETKKVDFSNEPIESLFFAFTDAHKKILNTMVRSNPKLMSGPFTMLVQNPRVLEFDNKKNYFDRQIHADGDKKKQKLQISVKRDQVFLDSYRALFFKSKELFRDCKLDINFKGEEGVDAGGVTREWYQVLSRQMFNPDYALFLPVASDKTTFHPNRTSWVNPEHLSFFKFIGRIIGKAIYDNCFLDCHFSRDVYKSILGRPVSLKDLETIDVEYYNSLMWMLENDITDVIIETFSVETEDYGEVKTVDLVPNGRNIAVNEENKNEYVRLVVEYRLQTSVKEQMDNFLQGFHEIIPKPLISIFDEQELELLISGLPDIDVDDWKNNTIYVNYSASSKEIGYFWRAVRSFDKEERAKLLQFATGTSKVPLNGFKELEGSNSSTKFSIHRDFGPTDRLPSSHTCFNQIDLPSYDSYETLRGSLLLAITEGHEGFGIA